MMTRVAKLLLLCGVALFYTLVVFNNLTDFNSNYLFVHHVLSMDTTFPGNQGMWRALPLPAEHLAFYWGIIAWETVTMLLLWVSAWRMLRTMGRSGEDFLFAKQLAIGALTLSMLMWLVAFLCVGAEWFLMWQSKVWNGQEAAFRMFVVVGIVMVLMMMKDE